MRRLYFDNAATSFPKPDRVFEAMDAFARSNGSSPRGRYREARDAADLVQTCRERIATLIGATNPEGIVFTLNTTDALNLAIHGMVEHRRRTEPGRPIHLVTSWLDHNSVLRVLNSLDGLGVEQTRIMPEPGTHHVTPGQVAAAIRKDTLLVAVNHASNVTGAVQPVAEIGRVCRVAGVPFLVDAAQSLGHVPVDVGEIGADLLAFPGHKGLLGPTGTGGLYIRRGMELLLEPVRQGGTGTRSEEDVQPRMLPDRFEPGSPNTVGIVGLSEGVRHLLDHGAESVREHERRLMEPILEGVSQGRFEGLSLLGPRDARGRVGVFSFVHESLSPVRIADLLEERFGILTRAGLHCAPLAHRMLGTDPPRGEGAVRLSLGPFLTGEEVEYACRALEEVCTERAPAGARRA
ncbi:MAG: aminotransferase class V-fold PLP-dependent enzyme [Phycisphaeraceae bacterium]|nr:aminotransferase class V-fold PLP-dependent enzyme [Phycisphaeraceae bacterium]